MEVKIERTTPVQAKVKIAVPVSTVNERFDAYYANLAKRAKIPGFRPGKAPKDVVKKMYAQDTASDLSERLISESIMSAVQEHKLSLVMPPVLVATDLPQENKTFTFEVEVDLKPEVPDVDLQSFAIEVADAGDEATDEEAQQRLNNMLEKDATFSDIASPRPVENGDCVVMSFHGTLDGKDYPGMTAESQTLVLGQGQFLPDFEKAMIGQTIGEERTADVGFPENYQAQDLQGKTAQFKIKLLQIKQKNLPELNDEFAKAMDSEVQTLDQLKAKLKEELSIQKKQGRQESLREAAGDALAEKFQFVVSKRQVESMAERIAQQTHQMMHQMGVQHEENEENAKSLFESSLKKAERDIRLSYILEKIARDQKLEVTQDDLNQKIEAMAKKTGLSLSQIRSYYAGKEENSESPRLERLQLEVLDEKSLDYAVSRATIKIKGS